MPDRRTPRPRWLRAASRQRPLLGLLAVLAVLAAAYLLTGNLSGETPANPSGSAEAALSSPVVATASAAVSVGPDEIAASALPAEARQTLALIAAGGPFPYDEDGSVFRNAERRLPQEPLGFYREYTVVTPGEDDRGPRRIVAGQDGTRWYTADHYATFRRIVEDA